MKGAGVSLVENKEGWHGKALDADAGQAGASRSWAASAT